MMSSSASHLSLDVAAETGIHIGDGGLSIKRGGPHGSYQYEVTRHALEESALSDRHCNAHNLRRVRPPPTWVLRQPRTDLDLPEISEQSRRTLQARNPRAPQWEETKPFDPRGVPQ